MIGSGDWKMENQSIFVIILILTALANAVSSIVAWIAKIGWSKEYKEAKDETIKAKEAEIRTLKEHIMMLEKLNPQILKQWYQNGLEMAQTYVAQVNNQLEDAQKKIKILETDKPHNRDSYEKAKYAYDVTKMELEKINAEVGRGQVPTWFTVATSVVTTSRLAETTSTEPPPIKNEFLKFVTPIFSIVKECPKCRSEMIANDDGDYHCEKCGHLE